MSLLRKKCVDAASSGTQPAAGMRRVMGPLDLTLLGVGAIIGTGIFVLTGLGAITAGPGLMLSFVIAGAAAMLSALCYAEFAAAMPVSGSVYAYSYLVLGELIAWIVGWDLILEYGIAIASVAVGWSGYFQSLLGSFGLHWPAQLGAAPTEGGWINLPALLVLLLISRLLAAGIHESTKINNLMVVFKTVVIVLFVTVGFHHVDPANWRPLMPHGWSGVFAASALMFFAYIGFDAVAAAVDEARNPRRDLPIGMLAALVCCTLLYIVVTAVMTGIVPSPRFAGSDHPVSLTLQVAGIGWLAKTVDVAAISGMFTVMLAMAYSGVRIAAAMARDGLLPAPLGVVSAATGTPVACTWGFGIVGALLAATTPLHLLAELVNMGTLVAFIVIAFAVIVLRRTHPELRRPFRCPAVPAVPLFAIGLCGFLIINLRPLTQFAYLVWIVVGLGVYFGYARSRALLDPRNQEQNGSGNEEGSGI